MVTRSVLTQVAVSVAAAALLAGCGGSDTPPAASAPTGTTSPTASSAPTSTAPTSTASSAKPATPSSATAKAAPLPPAAKAHTKAGAEAFVRAYFAEVVNRAWTTPTTAELGLYAKPSCKSCAASLATAARLVEKHQHYDGNPVRMLSASAQENPTTGTYFVATRVIQERRNVVDAKGKVVLTDQRVPLGLTVALEWQKGRWLIQTVKRSS